MEFLGKVRPGQLQEHEVWLGHGDPSKYPCEPSACAYRTQVICGEGWCGYTGSSGTVWHFNATVLLADGLSMRSGSNMVIP